MVDNETQFKRIFRDSVEKIGGFAFPISMSIMNGLPDLYCVIPGHIPVLLEAKWLKDIPECGKFKRKTPYRPLQRDYLKNSIKVAKGSAWCLMGIDCGEKKFCGFIHPDIEVITDAFTIDQDGCIPITDTIDVKHLFELSVPTIGKMMCEFST